MNIYPSPRNNPEPKAIKSPDCFKISEVGRMITMTPRKPTRIANQSLRLTFAFNKKIEKIGMKRGDVLKKSVALTNGMKLIESVYI
jgi:hypothetical protein